MDQLYRESHPEGVLTALFEDMCALAERLPLLGITKETQTRFDDIFRKVYISCVLYKQSTIAIAGLQGAGKTFFVKNYLGLDNKWLPDNMGRGERFPILIKEDSKEPEPYGEILKISKDGKSVIFSETNMTPTRFTDIVRGNSKEAGILLPILHIPPTPAKLGELSIVLLPGFEAEENEDWQKLMHHTMLSASLPVIVTSQDRLATDGNKKIRQLQENFFEMTPIVVYSHIDENLEKPSNGFEMVQGVFPIKSQDQLVYTGKGSAGYVDQWRKKFTEALDKNSSVQNGWRKKQLLTIEKMLSDELSDVLYDLKEEVLELCMRDDKDIQIEKILEKFDNEVKSLRKKFNNEVNDFVKDVVTYATKLAAHAYTIKEGGNAPKAITRSSLDWFINTEGKEGRLNSILEDVWKRTLKSHYSKYLNRITTLTYGQMRIKLSNDPQETVTGIMQKWGYSAVEEGEGFPITPEILEQLQILFAPKREVQERNTSLEKDTFFAPAIKLLPALALEFSRLTAIKDFHEKGYLAGQKSEETFSGEFGKTSETGKKIVTAIGTMLAIDFSADGKIDTIPALWKWIAGKTKGVANVASGATAIANPYVLIAVAAIIVITVAIAAVNKVNAEHKLCRTSLRNAIETGGVTLHSHILDKYDDLMDTVRETVENRLDDMFQRNHALGVQYSSRKLIARIDQKCKLLLGEIKLDSLLA